jgi:hypothetical protein
MLRAYRPDRFKTPGTQVNVGIRQSVFVFTEEERHRLQEIHRMTIAAEENAAATVAANGLRGLRNASDPPAPGPAVTASAND